LAVPKPLNIVTQGRPAWSKLFLAVGPEKQYPKLVLKFWALPQKIPGVQT